LLRGGAASVIAGQGDGLAPVAGRVEEDRVHQYLRGESRSRGRHDGRQPRWALTLWRRAGPVPAGIAESRAAENSCILWGIGIVVLVRAGGRLSEAAYRAARGSLVLPERARIVVARKRPWSPSA
jgi:hypothetical protein